VSNIVGSRRGLGARVSALAGVLRALQPRQVPGAEGVALSVLLETDTGTMLAIASLWSACSDRERESIRRLLGSKRRVPEISSPWPLGVAARK
jgi:hypothetical protein